MMRFILLLVLWLGILNSESKIALLIGNSDYTQKYLDNPTKDVDLLESKLTEIGFTVYKKKNLTKSEMINELKKFYKQVDKDTIALIYFSGHGVHSTIDGKNYLIPIGAFSSLINEGQLSDLTISDNYLLNSTLGAKFSILLLDACRSNDFAKTRGGEKGLGIPNPTLNSDYVISYATKVGETAQDGQNNSPYALALAKFLKSNYSIADMFTQIRKEVSKLTNGKQKPFYVSESNSIFYLNEREPIVSDLTTKELTECKRLSTLNEYKKSIEACKKLHSIIGEGFVAKALYHTDEEKKATKIFKKIINGLKEKCNLNNSDACHLVTVHYYRNHNYDKAILFAKKTCDLGNSIGCTNLGFLYEKGKNGTINLHKALKFYSKACDLKSGQGCHNIGRMYERGKGISFNLTKAIEFYSKACDLKNGQGCNALGLLYEKDIEVKQDYTKAKKYYEKAIEYNYSWGYNNLGLFYKLGRGVPKNYTKAKELFEKGCQKKNGTACNNLGRLYDKGLGVEKSDSLAIKYYTQACELNNNWGCNNMASYYRKGKTVATNYQKAFKLYTKACNLNNGSGCTTLGYMYENGQGTDKNIQQAIKFYKKGCKLKNASGCRNLGIFYKKGDVVDKNLQTAKKFYQKACDLGKEETCSELLEL